MLHKNVDRIMLVPAIMPPLNLVYVIMRDAIAY
jgi:hypothetical protein